MAHPDEPPQVIFWHCPTCKCDFTHRDQLRQITTRSQTILVCPTCRNGVQAQTARRVVPFSRQLLEALSFPWRRDGKYVYLPLAVMSWLFLIFAKYNVLPGINLLGYAIGLALPLGYWSVVVVSSTHGADSVPGPRDVMGLSDLLEPLLRFLAALSICFVPAIALGANGSPVAAQIATLAGIVLLPAQLLVAAHTWPINPLTAARIIVRVPRAYGQLLLAIGVVTGCALLIIALVQRILFALGVPLLPFFAVVALAIYALLVVGRMVGLLVAANNEELGIA